MPTTAWQRKTAMPLARSDDLDVRQPLDYDDDDFYARERESRFDGGGVIVWGVLAFSAVLAALAVWRLFG